jgi:translation initiation factor IF-3
LSRPFSPRSSSSAGQIRINGKIRAREVRVISMDGRQLGVFQLGEALNLARSQGVDLVEIAPTATPPVCRLVDYGKFRYEQSKRDKEARKHQHANKVKEIQLSPSIDPHDFSVKLEHAVDFLCEEIKVKVTLKFRGREMAHKEFGFQVVEKFINDVAAYGHPDAPPRLIGKGLSVMLSPLPRAKRAKHPRQGQSGDGPITREEARQEGGGAVSPPAPLAAQAVPVKRTQTILPKPAPAAFNNPFAKLDLSVRKDDPSEPPAQS